MNYSNYIRDKREKLRVLCFIRYSHYLWSYIVLYESGIGLVANVLQNPGQPIKK